MKKKHLFASLLTLTLLLSCKKVYAFDVNDYRYKNLCGNYEVAGFHSDGYIDPVECFNNFEDAKAFMKNNGANDLGILHNIGGQNKIVDANMALLDLSVNPTQLTYFYENSELSGRKYTYMDTGSLYGGVDGGLLDTSYSNSQGVFTAKVRIGNFTGWIPAEAYEIVPITWIKSYSHYTVTNEIIRHNYVTKIQNEYKSSGGNTIGPKPDMLNEGVYYSYDGHYFYDTIEKLMIDYKNNTYNNSVNKNNPYYNYYMYLSNHTRTAYSSVNIDEYIRNNLGYTKDVYGHAASANTSRLYGSGNFFYYAQEKYGVNAILSLSLSRNETGNGRSYLAINKNNGFGLNAVDSNPIGGANWYPTFGSSILGYANKWVTYGFAHPRDWRYFGPQFGDKWVGMNVKYASDTYWSEKMASYYYSLDKAFGMQDYNYYQLGVMTRQANAYSEPSLNSKFVYQYPEAEDAVVIVGETTVNNEKWYKLVSDLNIDSSFNEITSGNYNWNSYVYVKAEYIKKINNGKNGYISPNDVTEYQNKNYEYNMFIEDGDFKPRVGISTKNTSYYYDSTLTSKKNQTLLKDRYVVVFAIALENNVPVSYLVTSDYYYSQKEWVPADSIRLTDTPYGKVYVETDDNRYTWVNYNTEDASYSLIGGLYTYAYVPILASEVVNGETWYKVPVSLSTDENVYGYTLARYSTIVHIDVSSPISVSYPPSISVSDKEIVEGDEFNPLDDVSAYDNEDGDVTNKITIKENNVNNTIPGVYNITYEVTDSDNHTTTKTIKITVIENKAPVISTSDIEVTINSDFDELKEVSASDQEDGDLTDRIQIIESNFDIHTLGEYHIVYEVADSRGKTTTKERTITVVKDRAPVINAEDISVVINSEFKPMDYVEAIDPEDGDITDNVEIIENTVNTKVIGTYYVTYKVVDSSNNEVTKTINIKVVEVSEVMSEAIFYFDYLKAVDGKLQIKGYNAIKGMNNTLDEEIEYKLIFKSIENSNDVYELPIERITNSEEITRPVNSNDGFDYTYSWFKGNITTKNIPDGDYRLYILSVGDNKAAMSLIRNKVLKPQVASFKDTKYITTRNNYYEEDMPLEMIIRTEAIGTKTGESKYNQFNQYRTFKFEDEELHLKGTSYSYGMDLSEDKNVDRKIIFENKASHEKYTYNLGSITDGLYEVGTTLGDNLSKTRAWFDTKINITNIPVGEYVIYISNDANISDYGEFNELLQRDLSSVKLSSDNKTYSFSVNRKQRYRIELKVE